MHYLADLCRDEHRSMCLIVDNATHEQVRKMKSAQWAAHIYVRPIDMKDIVDDLIELSEAHDEFRRTKTLLIVDDDKDFLMIMKQWLKNHYKIVGVHSGVEAVVYLKDHNAPDLILLDYEMPDLDGYNVMQWLHGTPHAADRGNSDYFPYGSRRSCQRHARHRAKAGRISAEIHEKVGASRCAEPLFRHEHTPSSYDAKVNETLNYYCQNCGKRIFFVV